MTSITHAPARARMPLGRRVVVVTLAVVSAAGLAVGTASPAQASIGMYHVASSWYQSFAALTSTGGDGYFQARAKLGSRDCWGARSQTNTKAQADGFSVYDRGAWLYLNGRTWASA
ncbi:hypothetical protein ACF044_08550 [Microbacterium sp. NPDC016588]